MSEKTEIFTFEDRDVEGKLILENDSSKVYQIPNMSEIGFSGTNCEKIKKEFPNWDAPIKESLKYTYLLFKNGKAVLDYEYE